MVNDGVVRITFLGDLLCPKDQIRKLKKSAIYNYGCIFEDAKQLWAHSDYVVANLETPVAGEKYKLCYETMRFNAPYDFLKAASDAGISHVSLANNHILDRGLQGLYATIDNCDRCGLDCSGAYRSRGECDELFVKKIKGLSFAFISCTYGTNQGLKNSYLQDEELWHVDILKYPVRTKASNVRRIISNLIPDSIKDFLKRHRNSQITPIADCVSICEYDKSENRKYRERILSKIKAARNISDVVVVLAHCGGQFAAEPGEWQKKISCDFRNAGADIIVENHNHSVLRIEEFKDRGITTYALGDFCSGPIIGFENRSCQTEYSIVVHCYFDLLAKRFVSYDFDVCKSVANDDGIFVVRPCLKDNVSDVELQTVINRVVSK